MNFLSESNEFNLERHLAQQKAARGKPVVGKRVGAAFLDLVPLSLLAAALSERAERDGRQTFTLSGVRLLLMIVAFVSYYLVAELLTGTTPGKRIVGLAVAGASGRAADSRELVTRNVLRLVDGLPFLYLVGFIVMLASPGNQRVGDRVAETYVVSIATVEAQSPNSSLRSVRSAVVLVSIAAITAGAGILGIVA